MLNLSTHKWSYLRGYFHHILPIYHQRDIWVFSVLFTIIKTTFFSEIPLEPSRRIHTEFIKL